MIKKIKEKQNNTDIEKYIFILLIIAYISGIISGCCFIFKNPDNIELTKYLTLNNTTTNTTTFVIYLISAFLLKYSGILCGFICFLPFLNGIQNSVYYSKNLLFSKDINLYLNIINAIKDTATSLLLILYLIVIISQIIYRKYNIKKDLKYFSAYIVSSILIYIMHLLLIRCIF